MSNKPFFISNFLQKKKLDRIWNVDLLNVIWKNVMNPTAFRSEKLLNVASTRLLYTVIGIKQSIFN